MHLPPLYPITDSRSPLSLPEQIHRLGQAGFPLVQFRGKPLTAKEQGAALVETLRRCQAEGGWPAVCVNDRADLAVLAAAEGLAPWGLHLGQGDLPPCEARRLPGLESLHFGTSTHAPGEWQATDPACDHAGIGPFRATGTKSDHAEPVGLEGLRAGCSALRSRGLAPVAIGGLTLEDAADCFGAGAESLAMVGEVARSADPGALLWEIQTARWRSRPPLPRGRGVALVGGSGSGKSTLGPLLAQRMGLPLVDTDAEVERACGRSIPEIFAGAGEAAFRSLEAQAAARGLARPAVLVLGAGAWEDATTRRRVRDAGFTVLWLAEVPARAWSRVAGDPGRPLAGSREAFMARWAGRMPKWWEGIPVLPLGRTAEQLAEALWVF